MFVFLLFPDEMFPLKNKRSAKGVHREKDGICPHCGEVSSYKIYNIMSDSKKNCDNPQYCNLLEVRQPLF